MPSLVENLPEHFLSIEINSPIFRPHILQLLIQRLEKSFQNYMYHSPKKVKAQQILLAGRLTCIQLLRIFKASDFHEQCQLRVSQAHREAVTYRPKEYRAKAARATDRAGKCDVVHISSGPLFTEFFVSGTLVHCVIDQAQDLLLA